VDPDDFGDLDHGQGLEVSDAFLHEFALPIDDLGGDVADGLLALVEAFDEEFPGADLFADILANFGGRIRLRHQILVSVADAQMRDLLIIGGDEEIFARLDHEHFRQNVLIVIGEEGASGRGSSKPTRWMAFWTSTTSWPKPRAISGMRRLPRASMKSWTMRYSLVCCLFLSFELKEEAFAQVACTDAGGVEGLNDVEHAQDEFGGQTGAQGHFLDGRLEVAVIIDVADDHLGDRPLFIGDLRKAHLFKEMFLERSA